MAVFPLPALPDAESSLGPEVLSNCRADPPQKRLQRRHLHPCQPADSHPKETFVCLLKLVFKPSS